ncbi:hypothetical protein ILUMI_09323 [Ignelater luminosus]|uniref:Uncharacterized protein n=1 Tax=Ignelater luminosus TaxID=2038154 RepID=A0A8K0D2M6_IGNLU|nr:hypothetical protein ILUMI_09323 [Ignelater luminosus]
MKAEILLYLVLFINYTFGYYPSGSALGSSLFDQAKSHVQLGRGNFGLLPGHGLHSGKKGAILGSIGTVGMMRPGIDTVVGGDSVIQVNGQNVINIACNDNTPYQDNCKRPCYCQKNQIYCPNTDCIPDDGGFNFKNRCPGNGISFENDCNTCFCFTVGLVCTANECSITN